MVADRLFQDAIIKPVAAILGKIEIVLLLSNAAKPHVRYSGCQDPVTIKAHPCAESVT